MKRTCSIEECGKPHHAHGWCLQHYCLDRRPRRDIAKRAAERFWRKVEKTNSCWLWTGACDSDGYGKVRRDNHWLKAHRYAYELLVGPIPEELPLDHVRARGCLNRHCVNPAHLEPVTLGENLRRSHAYRPPRSHCKQGHPFDLLNTYVKPNGKRQCRECQRAMDRRYRDRRVAQGRPRWD